MKAHIEISIKQLFDKMRELVDQGFKTDETVRVPIKKLGLLKTTWQMK